jgi:hypothetical protein
MGGEGATEYCKKTTGFAHAGMVSIFDAQLGGSLV